MTVLLHVGALAVTLLRPRGAPVVGARVAGAILGGVAPRHQVAVARPVLTGAEGADEAWGPIRARAHAGLGGVADAVAVLVGDAVHGLVTGQATVLLVGDDADHAAAAAGTLALRREVSPRAADPAL